MSDFNGNIVSLRDYIEARLADLLKWIESEIEAIREAVLRADEAMEKRLDQMNAFRKQIETAEERFVHKSEFKSLSEKMDLRDNQLGEDINDLRGELAELRTGRYVTDARLALLGVIVVIIVGAIATIVGITL